MGKPPREKKKLTVKYSEVSTSSIVAVPRHQYQYELHIKKSTEKNLLLPFMGLFRASSAWRILTSPESALAPFWPLESHGMTRTSSLSLRSLTLFFLWGFLLLRNTTRTLQLKASSAPPALSASRLLKSLRFSSPQNLQGCLLASRPQVVATGVKEHIRWGYHPVPETKQKTQFQGLNVAPRALGVI